MSKIDLNELDCKELLKNVDYSDLAKAFEEQGKRLAEFVLSVEPKSAEMLKDGFDKLSSEPDLLFNMFDFLNDMPGYDELSKDMNDNITLELDKIISDVLKKNNIDIENFDDLKGE